MKHLVTGGSGFLGNLISRRLAARGKEVVVLDVWEDKTRPREIRFIHGDVCVRETMAQALRGIDFVHHNAALVPLTKSGSQFWEVNVNGSRIVAEEAAKAGVKNFVHMSSSAIFGTPSESPITDSTPIKPVEIYGRAKWAGECAVREVSKKTGMPLVVIRPRTLLGEGRLGIFQILFDWIQENRTIYIIGKGQHPFQFLHAMDLMDAYLLACDQNVSATYNVGTDRFGTLHEALSHLIDYAHSQSRIQSLPVTPTILALKILDGLRLSPLAPWHYLTYHKPFAFDVAPLQKLGWKPKYSNDAMLQESYDWFCENRESGVRGRTAAFEGRLPQARGPGGH